MPPVGDSTENTDEDPDQTAARSSSSTRWPSSNLRFQPAGPPNNKSAAAASSPTPHLRRKVSVLRSPVEPTGHWRRWSIIEMTVSTNPAANMWVWIRRY